jgi:hypothetical protein
MKSIKRHSPRGFATTPGDTVDDLIDSLLSFTPRFLFVKNYFVIRPIYFC